MNAVMKPKKLAPILPVTLNDERLQKTEVNPVLVQTFQGTLLQDVLHQPCEKVIQHLLDGILRAGAEHDLENPHLRAVVRQATTLGELFLAVWPKDLRYTLPSAVLRAALRDGILCNGRTFQTDPVFNGIPLAQEMSLQGKTVLSGEVIGLNVHQVAILSIEGGTPAAPLVSFQVKRRMRFFPAVPFASFVDDFRISGRWYVPVLDVRRGARFVFKSVRDQKPGQVGYLVKYGRMSEAEMNAYEQASPMKDIVTAVCTTFSDRRRIWNFLPRDLQLLPSNALAGEVKKMKAASPVLQDLADLVRLAHSKIMEAANERSEDFQQMLGHWSGFLTPISAEPVRCFELPVFTRHLPRHGSLTKIARPVLVRPVITENERNTPQQSTISKLFHSSGGGGRFQKCGIVFNVMEKNLFDDLGKPGATIQAIEATGGGHDGVLLIWRAFAGSGRLPNHRLVEWECLLRMWPVQHMVDQGNQQNAVKHPQVFNGVMSKFGAHNSPFGEHPSGTICVGLDVSRHSGLDVPAMTMAMDMNGVGVCHMPENLPTDIHEKRTEEEIVEAIRWAIRMSQAPVKNVVFLRDGLPLENYEAIAGSLDVPLTVIAVRKKQLSVFPLTTQSDTQHAFLGYPRGQRIRFGLNPSTVADGQVRWLNEAEVVRDPLNLGIQHWGEQLVELTRLNPCSQAGLAGLPAPIAYADRMANALLDMMLDEELQRHVERHHRPLRETHGDLRQAIYSVIRRFILNHPKGSSWAV